MTVVRLPSKVVFQLLELPLVLGEDERVLINRSDLLMDPGEGLLRARLFLAELPDQVGTVHEPFQFPRDSRHALFQSSFVSEGAERGLPVDVGPERGDLTMELVDPVLGLVASLLVLVLRLEILHLPGAGFEGGLELRDARSSLFALLIQTSELFLQCGEAAERFLPRGDLGILRLDVPLHGGESFLRPLQGLFEDLKPEEFLKHREPLRPARGPELLHLLLPDEGGVPESIVVETDHVADRPLLVRDRPLHRLPVTRDFEVRFLLGREAAGDVPPFVTLVERQADVSVRTTHVRELYALDIRPGRLAVQGERDGVQYRRFPRARAARDYGVFLRKPERRDPLLAGSR